MKNEVYYLAHMLDESSHASYYDMYMQEHPEDKLPKLIDSLIGEFAEALKKDHIDLKDHLTNGQINYKSLDQMQDKLKQHYHWELIPAKTYAAIISRSTALFFRSKGQRFSEADEIQFDDVSRMVSRRTVEDCLDIICHNTNVLEANNTIILNQDKNKAIQTIFEKHRLSSYPIYYGFAGTLDIGYSCYMPLYKKWASYAKGKYGEKYVCDSDNGPADLKKILDSVEYSADDIDLVVALNKALDVVHFRSDLAAAFIEGGQKTCALVSNLPDKFVI